MPGTSRRAGCFALSSGPFRRLPGRRCCWLPRTCAYGNSYWWCSAGIRSRAFISLRQKKGKALGRRASGARRNRAPNWAARRSARLRQALAHKVSLLCAPNTAPVRRWHYRDLYRDFADTAGVPRAGCGLCMRDVGSDRSAAGGRQALADIAEHAQHADINTTGKHDSRSASNGLHSSRKDERT